MLWAWERRSDLRFVEGLDVGVAFYASTVVVDERGVSVRPRRSPLYLPDSTYRLAVMRVEPSEDGRVVANEENLAAIVSEAQRLLSLRSVRGLQLDFDARSSEREAHREIVRALKSIVPSESFFSVTSLASHCFADPLEGESASLPDELVPMYFRMGTDDAIVRRSLLSNRGPSVERCRASAGFADDESRPAVRGFAREYLFLTGPLDTEPARARVRAFITDEDR